MGKQLRFLIILALIVTLVASCAHVSKRTDEINSTIIIAHRGAPNYAKENTIESFKKAIALGADMVEFDVRRTRDNVFITYHDEIIQGKPIKNLTYEDIGKIARSLGFDVPTVEDLLKHTSGKIRLDVELKEEGYEIEIIELLSKYFKEDQFIITSFYDASLKTIKDNYPDMKVGLLLGRNEPKNLILTRISEFFPMKRCIKAKADFLVPHWKLLRYGFLKRAQKNNKPVFVWTVNDRNMIWKLLNDERIDGIITDKPDLALSLRKKLLWLKSIRRNLAASRGDTRVVMRDSVFQN